jgi:hypothetical protein
MRMNGRGGRTGIAMTIAAIIVVGAIAVALWRRRATQHSDGSESVARSPLPRTVTVEVLNSGKVVGAARVGTLLLRHAGLDVVDYGDAGEALGGREHSQVLVRRGDTTGAGRVIEAIGSAEIIDSPDQSRLVDLTVLLGKDFAPSGRRRN